MVKKIRQDPMEGVLIMPDWKSARLHSYINHRKGELKWPFKDRVEFRPTIQQTSGGKSALQGCPKFAMLALFFDSKST